MDESERLERYRMEHDSAWADEKDAELGARILALLNHPKIDKYCMVDAYYYDFSVIPRGVQEKLDLWRDAYLIFGITTEGEIISKWVDRWDLDSGHPIVDAKVIHPPFSPGNKIPEISQDFNIDLLASPIPVFFRKFTEKEE